MAKVKIQGHASGTGILTVTAPNTSTDRTITLPDATGTLATTADTFNPDAAVVFNESGANVDFRVESDNNANMLFVDGGANAVGIGNAAPESPQSTWSSLQVGGQTILQGINSADPTGEMELGFNVYRHTDGANRHIATGAGAKIYMCTGAINFQVSNGSQNADTSYTMTEAMNIRNDGDIEIGACIQQYARLNLRNKSGTTSCMTGAIQTNGGAFADFYNSGNGHVGAIRINASATAYETSSDYRLKENVDYTWDATTRLKQLKPARFNFIADDTNTLVDGFIAHEVSSVVPEAISGTKDGTKTITNNAGEEETVPEYQGIDQSKLVPLLVKAMQEQQTTIESLTARITALEA